MGRILFKNGRDEKIEVNIVFENGGKRNFPLDKGEEEPQNCNDGETLFWGWFPFTGPGKGNPEPDCPATCGETIVIEDQCKLEG